ncbi:PA14 domain-containing protein [Sneathiella aquimaris]|uniref:PA14 domain-containing protein n=1 Tax=Sneathiella aquimaris TaxID=2599305 RepID=UPI00146C4948|nr:PA14 domain-containing protein [Sneathiella aquimaris]
MIAMFGKFVKGVAIGVGLSVAATVAQADVITGLKPASPQPAASALKPGLAVQYYGAKLNSIREFIEWMEYDKGKAGPPIPQLNYQVGQGPVLTATATDMVGADITGFINFERSGPYTFMVHSNDGVRLTIGDKMIYEDPEVHADRFSDEITLEISEPGWYPVRVLYFEKKNTSTLELYWDPPGPEEVDYVPTKAFAHIGK